MAEPPELPSSFDSFFTSDLANRYDSLDLTESQCLSILSSDLASTLFDRDADVDEKGSFSVDSITRRKKSILQNAADRSRLFHVGYAALCSFVQANVTGPPLSPSIPQHVLPSSVSLGTWRQRIIRELSVDGEAAYGLIPHVELFVVAKAALAGDLPLLDGCETGTVMAHLARLRVNFVHQKLLAENAESLQRAIYQDLDVLADKLLYNPPDGSVERSDKVRFLLESATIHTQHGLDERARADLEAAAKLNGFEFAVTGRLGKRTKFQTRDYSQLVVLAQSGGDTKAHADADGRVAKPKALDLDDDTLLESISFTKQDEAEKKKKDHVEEKSLTVQDESALSPALAALDPSDPPQLSTLDSITLLSIASAITNTSPDYGLTREETIPYATRVLDSGSTNWQVYSQALLVRSRIESHASRTVERSVLQLQTLVDQVIADTTTTTTTEKDRTQNNTEQQPTTFLPRPEAPESAPAVERIKYLWYINFPTRWALEAELAQRWVSLGGLRTALEIYERLQMWAEAALCYAATEREDKARLMVRRQLYRRTNVDFDNDTYEGPELDVLPPDAPRMFCILGDIDTDPAMYERAWTVSKHRYARAQRSLARYYISSVKPPVFDKAEEAYRKSLQVAGLNHGAWFALGCVQLELQKWQDAVESFTRTVQLEESDAEAWSNLAAALVNLPRPSLPEEEEEREEREPRAAAADDEEQSDTKAAAVDMYKPHRDALAALHRAARFKRDDHRIWDNLLTVATSIPPPTTPFRDVLLAFRRIIELRGPKDGEKCVDPTVLAALVTTLETDYDVDSPDISDRHVLRPGTLPVAIVRLVDELVVPLITHSAKLWLLVTRVESWRGRPAAALDAHEKAWRAAVAAESRAAFEMGEERQWMAIVVATETLVRKGYAVFGGMERERERDDNENEDGVEGQLVAKDWRFKARSAVRGILGKGKEFWEGTEGWDRLKELASDVSGG